MKQSIKNIVILVVIAELGLITLLAYTGINLRSAEDVFRKAANERFILLEEADILRQSSIDLTLFARTYVVTNDKQYRDNYHRILAIRNGEIQRPVGYGTVYWDLMEPTRTRRHPNGEKISETEIISSLPYSEEEREKLRLAEKNSNDLVNLEVEAFNAMEGKFKDNNGEYTVIGEPDQAMAIRLLHSHEYHSAKHIIMLPIDEFTMMLNKRTQIALTNSNNEVDYYLQLEYLFVFLFVLYNIYVALLFNKRIIKPVRSITRSIIKQKETNQPLSFEHGYHDEIKIMLDEFELMNRKLTELSRATENSPASVIITTKDGTIKYVNPTFCKVSGYSQEEAIGNNPRLLKSDKLSKSFYKNMWETILSGETWRGDFINLKKSGEEYWESSSISPIKNSEGEITHFVAVKQDITERKRMEDEIRHVNFLSDSALDLTKAGYWHVPLDGSGWYNSSERAAAIFGDHPREGHRYQVMDEWFANVQAGDEEAAKLTLENFQAAAAGEIPVYDSTYAYKRPVDGKVVWIHALGHVVKDEHGKPTDMFGVTQDITDFKNLEFELLRAKGKAEEATRAKSDFLANMSHEIRTPMNGIMGMTELLLDTELTQEQREYLNTIDFSAESLLTLIDGILDFSKIEANKLELDPIDFDLRERLGETLDTLAVRAHGKGLELAFDIDEVVPQMLVGDVNRIRQIIMNLVGNALKFTDSGEVVVNVTVESREKSDVLLHFSVSDTGIGIPVERLNSIFNSFEQADTSTTRKYGGTGLGLTICSRLIELMGGRIWVKSTPGTGTVFHFTTAMQVSTQTRRDVNLEALGELGKLRVLVVDDNKTNRRILEKMLSNWHMDPTLAEAAHQGLDTLHNAFEARLPFDLIISDVNMPEMDGFDFVKKIKSKPELATIPIILLTSANRSGDKQRCYDLGAQAHLVKPVRQSKMLDVIMTTIGMETVIRKHDAQHSDKDSESVTTGPLSILLAEDNEVNQKFALRVLDKAGHITTVVNNGREAVDAMGDNKFDLILMDVQMPEMDGYEATAEIRRLEQQAGTHIPIIALTAHAMKGDREKCLEAGMDGYITKPIKSKTLLAEITNVMSA